MKKKTNDEYWVKDFDPAITTGFPKEFRNPCDKCWIGNMCYITDGVWMCSNEKCDNSYDEDEDE